MSLDIASRVRYTLGMATAPLAPALVSRHHGAGARVTHREHGTGTVTVHPVDGSLYPVFDNGTVGTPYTRVRAAS